LTRRESHSGCEIAFCETRLRNSTSLTTRVLVGSVGAVFLAIAEESALDAVAVTAGEESVLAERLVGDQQRLHLALFVLQLAVLHRIFPVASLLLDVEVQTGRTTNGLETLEGEEETISAERCWSFRQKRRAN
jgi:hypothetical protein